MRPFRGAFSFVPGLKSRTFRSPITQFNDKFTGALQSHATALRCDDCHDHSRSTDRPDRSPSEPSEAGQAETRALTSRLVSGTVIQRRAARTREPMRQAKGRVASEPCMVVSVRDPRPATAPREI
jgi:hypothetical protein